MKKLNKSIKLAILEGWYGIDSIFFKEKLPSSVLNEEEYKLYNTIKSSMLYNLYEIYKIIGHGSTNKYTSLKEMVLMSKENALNIREDTIEEVDNGMNEDILTESVNICKGREMIITEQAAQMVIPRLITSFTLDNFLLVESFKSFDEKDLGELSRNKKLNFYLDAHDKFRNSLVELVYMAAI